MSLDSLLHAADAARDEVVALTQSLVRIDTTSTGVMPTGNETPAAELLRDTLAADGITDARLYCRVPERANLVARLPGASGRAKIMLLGHTDVVPIGDRSLWTQAPFGAAVIDGRLYGRGASDMKGTDACEVVALKLLRRSRLPLRHDALLVTVADEESGGEYGARWLAENHGDALACDYCVNEGGGSLTEAAGRLTCTICLGEKGRYEAHIEIPGRGSHAAHPWFGDNAFYHLADALAAVRAYEPERQTKLPFFEAVRQLFGGDAFHPPVTPANVDAFAAAVEKRDRGMGDACRGLSRLTIVPSVLAGGNKSNSVPDSVKLICDLRSLPDQSEEYLKGVLRGFLASCPGARLTLHPTAPSTASHRDERFLDVLGRSVGESLGREVTVLPGLTTGYTDSRCMRPLGITAYGCTPGHPSSIGQDKCIHAPDEWTSVDDLAARTRFFVAVLYHALVAGELD